MTNGGIMVENKTNVNEYILHLLSNKQFCVSEYSKYIENGYYIENIDGIVTAELLSKLIRQAKRNKKIRALLSDLLYYVDEKSLTNSNFVLLCKFPKRLRVTYLDNIAHNKLSFYQMQILNRYPSFEAFSWLFDNICKYDIFTDEDMLQILRENHYIRSAGIGDCIKLALDKYGNSSKLEIAEKWRLKLQDSKKY